MSAEHGGYTEIRIGYIPFFCQWASEALEAIVAVLIEYLLNKRNITATTGMALVSMMQGVAVGITTSI